MMTSGITSGAVIIKAKPFDPRNLPKRTSTTAAIVPRIAAAVAAQAEFEIPLTDDELEGLFAHDDTYLERSKLLKEAYRKLSANQRHAVYLYYIKELTWEEVAEILGITVHSSMNLIGRAIVKLRRLFENK